jgi:hypothetical protein
MLNFFFVWASLLVALLVFAVGRPGKGGALTIAYFLGLSLIHVPGLLPFIGSGPGLFDRAETRIGFELTLVGMAAFVVGAVLARKIGTRRPLFTPLPAPQRALAFERIGWRALAVGSVTYFVLIPLSVRVPSLTSLVSALATFLILGLWLVFYGAVETGDRGKALLTLLGLPLLPLGTLVTGGFLGYGVYWVLSIIAFLFTVVRRRTWFYAAAPVAVFLGLSLFVTYMGQRAEIRELVWEEHASLIDRLDRVSRLVTDLELLDPSSQTQMIALDKRLNQNWLVGLAVMRHEAGWTHFAHGATVPVWGLVPRAVWPDKPGIGGGRDVVGEYTGIYFSRDTSVGAGQVLEFYANFGTPGVLAGFLALGFLLMRLDDGIMHALAAGDVGGLLLRVMPGLTLLQPGGNLLEILIACVAACVAAYAVVSLKFFAVPTAPRAGRQAA